jgi:RNA polymerase sigma-70 factor, ECF subfamily
MTHHSPIATRGTEWDWERVRALCLKETRRLLGTTSTAADDAAQEATIRAWKHRARCRTPNRPEPWITTIARRDMVDLRQVDVDVVGSLDLWRAMSAMDGQDRRLLVGHYWQDLPNSELAKQLGLAEVTVRVRLHRIRQRLRDTLKEI